MISPTLKESGRKKKKEYQGDKERHPPKKSQSGAAKNADQEIVYLIFTFTIVSFRCTDMIITYVIEVTMRPIGKNAQEIALGS